MSRSETDGVNLLESWTTLVREAETLRPVSQPVDVIASLAAGRIKLTSAIEKALGSFEDDDPDDDLKDDLNAWRKIWREIRASHGPASLDRLLQELQLRSKEPVPEPGTVTLTTIHGAKGLEFDTVYLIGLAEEVLPAWHSVRKGNGSAALEEERRGCFVAITRTKRCLILSRGRTGTEATRSDRRGFSRRWVVWPGSARTTACRRQDDHERPTADRGLPPRGLAERRGVRRASDEGTHLDPAPLAGAASAHGLPGGGLLRAGQPRPVQPKNVNDRTTSSRRCVSGTPRTAPCRRRARESWRIATRLRAFWTCLRAAVQSRSRPFVWAATRMRST